MLTLPYGAVCKPHKEEINTFRNLCFNCNSVYLYPDAHSAYLITPILVVNQIAVGEVNLLGVAHAERAAEGL